MNFPRQSCIRRIGLDTRRLVHYIKLQRLFLTALSRCIILPAFVHTDSFVLRDFPNHAEMSKRLIITVVVAIAILLSSYSIWKKLRTQPNAERPIRIAYLPISSDASFFVAFERGFFSNQGLNTEPVKFETSNQVLEALVAGRIDAAAPVALEAALTLEANTPDQFQIVEMTAATAQTKVHRIEVRPDSPIRVLGDLRGKKIGTFPGSQMLIFLKLILGRYFDVNKELQIVQLSPPLQPQALDSGQVDALFCLEPTCTQLESSGLARAISVNPLYEFIQQPFPTAASIVSSRLAKERPDVIDKLVRALNMAHDYLKTNPNEAALTVSKYAPIDPALAPRISFYDYWSIEAIDRNAVQRLADLYADKGILTKKISTASLYATPKL
jgi:NitT/TauT family transport system substrate-binding protein